MDLKRLLGLALAVAVGGGVIALWPRHQKTPEERLRAAIGRAVVAVEARDLGGATSFIAEDFRGPGGSSAQDAKQLLAGFLLRAGQGLSVLNPALSVTMETARAGTFTGTFLIAHAGDDPNSGGLGRYEFTGRLEERDGDWLLVQLSWRSP